MVKVHPTADVSDQAQVGPGVILANDRLPRAIKPTVLSKPLLTGRQVVFTSSGDPYWEPVASFCRMLPPVSSPWWVRGRSLLVVCPTTA